MKQRTTKIRVLNETWKVPRGFGAVYQRMIKEHLALIAAGKPEKRNDGRKAKANDELHADSLF